MAIYFCCAFNRQMEKIPIMFQPLSSGSLSGVCTLNEFPSELKGGEGIGNSQEESASQKSHGEKSCAKESHGEKSCAKESHGEKGCGS